MLKKEKEIKAIFIFIAVLFFMFLALPVFFVLIRSFQTDSGAVGFAQYVKMFSSKDFMTALWHSLAVAGTSGFVTVILAFILAYTVNNTDIHPYPLHIPSCHYE